MKMNEIFMFGVSDAVKRLRPDSVFEITNDKFTKWYDPNGLPAPTWQEVMDQMEIDKKEYDRLQYFRDRSAEYPNITEQLDMIWHDMNSGTIAGKDSKWFNLINSIKLKYPKR
jgi:hypothetical protein